MAIHKSFIMCVRLSVYTLGLVVCMHAHALVHVHVTCGDSIYRVAIMCVFCLYFR